MTPPLDGRILFNAQHAPLGAFFSFTCGCADAAGGMAAELGKPAAQNLYVGVKDGALRDDAPLRALPFFRPAARAAADANYDVENPNASNALRGIDKLDASQLTRHYGWATDTFVAPGFTFAVHSPFFDLPDPEAGDTSSLRDALLPAVTATLTVDNRHGKTIRTAIFAIDFTDSPGTRQLTGKRYTGFAWRRRYGFAGRSDEGELQPIQSWSVHRAIQSASLVHPLGTCGGLALEVPPGQQRTLTLALGVYLEGPVTTGLEGRYYYTRLYRDLDDVLAAALDRAPQLRKRSLQLDAQLLASSLGPAQRFLVAHGTRSYHGSTQLLDIDGKPFWVVNEGEYCMMNTLDLSIDHAFWELDRNPWVVRNILDNFREKYSYRDQCGLSFTHDMGADNHFAPQGRSSYELPKLTGCFSYMTQEQLCNWILLAACYAAKTGDTAWLKRHASVLAECGESLRRRADADGLMRVDSDRCEGGSEITTYDSLDESLGQARANTYIAVKCWASWLALDLMHRMIGPPPPEVPPQEAPPPEAIHMADAIAAVLARSVDADGTLPAVLEPDNPGYHSRILPVIEALIYPAYWLRHVSDARLREPVEAALASPMIDVLRGHTLALLLSPGTKNLFADGGLRLSSTSDNSWMSKIAVFQFVARAVLRLHEQDERVAAVLAKADAAHAAWQTEGSAYWACSDQFIRGEAKGSRYYPRIITAALWLDERPIDAPAHVA